MYMPDFSLWAARPGMPANLTLPKHTCLIAFAAAIMEAVTQVGRRHWTNVLLWYGRCTLYTQHASRGVVCRPVMPGHARPCTPSLRDFTSAYDRP